MTGQAMRGKTAARSGSFRMPKIWPGLIREAFRFRHVTALLVDQVIRTKIDSKAATPYSRGEES